MSTLTDKLRAQLDAETREAVAKLMLQRWIRHAALRAIFNYSQAYFIVDFEDTQLVDQKHRDYYNTVKSAAAAHAADVTAATTKAELLAVFDQIEKWLE